MLIGEEEIGSTHLENYLEQHFKLLKSDVLILADTGNYDIGIPSITYRSLSSLFPSVLLPVFRLILVTSLRGIVGLDVTLRTVQASVHSGMWGGPVMDPLAAVCMVFSYNTSTNIYLSF